MNRQLKFNRFDYRISHAWWGANCGPVALAAILNLRLGDVRRLAPEAETFGGLTIEGMKEAIARSGRKWKWLGTSEPLHGLAALMWLDQYGGHWIAVSGGNVIDNFTCKWTPREEWAANILPRIVASGGSYNYKTWGIEIER
jgi:hypothetical protein